MNGGGLQTQVIGTDDLSTCQTIFDSSYYDLHRQHGMDDAEPDDSSWLVPILRHFLGTDPAGARIAVDAGAPVAFASTVRRDDYWFLSFLFVLPSHQGRGIGRMLLTDLLPDDGEPVVRATVVESFQPVSTGLYASVGITPRAVKYWLSGVSRPDRLTPPSADLERTTMSVTDRDDVDRLDRTVLGFARRRDHRWWGEAGTPAWVYRRGHDLVAYAYVDEGFIGPALADDEATLCSVVADLVRTSADPAGMAINVCGDSAGVFRMLVDAGARIDASRYRFVYCSSSGPLPSSYLHHADWLP